MTVGPPKPHCSHAFLFDGTPACICCGQPSSTSPCELCKDHRFEACGCSPCSYDAECSTHSHLRHGADLFEAPVKAIRHVRPGVDALTKMMKGPIGFPVVHRETGAPAGEVVVEPGKEPEIKLHGLNLLPVPPSAGFLNNPTGRIHYLDIMMERAQRHKPLCAITMAPHADPGGPSVFCTCKELD